MRTKNLCLGVSLVVVAALATLAIGPAIAVTYVGQLNSPIGISGGGAWVNPGSVSLTWVISRDDSLTGPWTYNYTLSAPIGPIQHWILELTPGVTSSDIFNITPGVQTQIRWFEADDPSTPGMPAPIYGINFQNINQLTHTVSFQTFIEPVWGDFYARDGVDGGTDNFAFNSSFAVPDPDFPPTNCSVDCKVLRPDRQVGPVIPEPSSVMLGFMGLVPFIAARRLARK